MKKSLIAVAFLSSSAFVGVANAIDGTINFTGSISPDACTVNVGSGSAPIDMGNISSSALASVGDSASRGDFKIVLSACSAGATTAAVKFDGQSDKDDPTLLGLASGGATGVAIGLYEEDGTTKLPLGSSSLSKPIATGADTEFNFVAKYVATGTVVDGAANALAQFTVDYN
ncbi:fimbrial protein [Pseudomonas sp. TH31]|uniref:fimbrial protein n=1 Tax=Pseudomonas sp. TH31 TaxID=2796396 RepID=UPI001911503D|nr:fimbrial protein [Pseudomonas sp. TH31]MBK5413471.1 fimbrial protein [Pseudomonas sp. TH31]